ncbi:MAG: hypothetical protein ACJ78Q_00650 [Chloroflexia bacterium]
MKINTLPLRTALLALGLAALLAGCGTTGDNGTATNKGSNDTPRQQFLAERSGTVTPGVVTNTTAYGQSNGGDASDPASMPVFGSVESASPDSLVITNSMDNTKTNVKINNDTKITKQVAAQLSEIKKGDKVVATGQEDGDAVAALLVQLGVDSTGGPMPFFGAPVTIGGPGPAQGGPAPDSAQPQQMQLTGKPKTAAGTIDTIDGSNLTIKLEDGTTTLVKITNNTHLQRTEDVQASDIKTGDSITAEGTHNGDTLEATQITVMPDTTTR